MRCLGTIFGMLLAFVVGIGLVLGGLLWLKSCAPATSPDQQLWAAPEMQK